MMVDANEKDEAPKLNSSSEKDVDESVIVPSTILSNIEEEEDKDDEEYDDDDDDDEEEEDDDEYEEDVEELDEEGEEEVNDGGKAMVVVNYEGINTNEEHNKGKAIVEEETNKENNVKDDAVKGADEKKSEDQKNGKELDENSKRKEKRPRPRPRPRNRSKKVAQNVSETLAVNGDKPETSSKKNASKRVESMGMVFMCTSKTKTDCFRYKILGLPANKKDQVAKIYKGMRLFLFDVDLRLMYGIFKAAGPGGYNIEPKAFKSDFPAQVRFTVLEDCLPVAEERFKEVIKENYYTRNKFEGLLKADQVKKLCKLFVVTGKGGPRPNAALKPRRTEAVERRRSRADDAHTSREQKKRKRRPREEERRPHSPPGRGKRRYTDYERPPILYEREVPVPRYLPLPPPVVASPVRSYGYERALDPYVRDHVPEHHPYRVLDVEVGHHGEIRDRDRDRDRDWDRDRERDRDRDAYYVYSREAPSYRDTVYSLPLPEYRVVSSRDYHPPAVHPPEYRLSGGSRVPSYRDVGPAPDYRSSLHEYRPHRTHYRY